MLKWAFSRLWSEELGHRVLSSLYFIVKMCSIQQFFIRLMPTLIIPSVFNLSNVLLVCAIKHTSVNYGQWWWDHLWGTVWSRVEDVSGVACSWLLRFTNDLVGLLRYQHLSSALSSLLNTAFKPYVRWRCRQGVTDWGITSVARALEGSLSE